MKQYNCSTCDKDFTSKDALEMHVQSKHISKEEAVLRRSQQKKLQRVKHGALYLVGVIIVVFFLIWVTQRYEGGTYSKGEVHWHADLSILICDEQVPLPQPLAGQTAHGQSFIGTPLMHLHNEPVIHVEGTVQRAEDITLGKFMKTIGMTFTREQILDKKNGDSCPDGRVGEVKLLVNGIKNDELNDKVIIDGERYQILFE